MRFAWRAASLAALSAATEGITLGLQALFPDGIVNRTDLAKATNASPCYADVEVLPSFPYPLAGERPDAAKARCGRDSK